jgi:transposase
MIKVGHMIKRYLWGIINAIMARVSNAAAESMNAKIQWIKKKACRYRSRARFRNDILFHFGGLDLMPKTLGAHAYLYPYNSWKPHILLRLRMARDWN